MYQNDKERLDPGFWLGLVAIIILLFITMRCDAQRQVSVYDTIPCKINCINLLRKRLLKNKSSNVEKMNKNVLYAFVIKTWNAYVTGAGESVKILKFDTERDEYPKFILNK